MQHRVQRPRRERQERLRLVLEGVGQLRSPAAGQQRAFHEVVQARGAVGGPQQDAQALERLDGEQDAAGQDDLVLPEVPADGPGLFLVLGVTGVVRGVLAFHPRIGGAVDGFGVRVQPGQTAREEHLAQPLGCQREIRDGAEPAEALSEYAPRPAAGELTTDQLGVADDGVGPVEGQPLRLVARGADQREGLPVQRGGAPGAALVQQQHAVVVCGASEPAALQLGVRRTGGRVAWAAFEVEQPGAFGGGGTGGGDLAGEDLDLLAVGAVVVQRHREDMVGQPEPGLPVGGRLPGAVGAVRAEPGPRRGSYGLLRLGHTPPHITRASTESIA